MSGIKLEFTIASGETLAGLLVTPSNKVGIIHNVLSVYRFYYG